MNLAQYFPDEDYRLTMRFERQAPEDFFASTQPHVLVERQRWLAEAPHRYAAVLSEGAPILAEARDLFRSWPATREGLSPDLPAWEAALELGRQLETDWLLLVPDDGSFRLVAGCVCFPSSWSLEEKMGHPLEAIHGVVPGLNAQVGKPAAGFLAKMAPGIAWLRANWGLSRSPELNQHPDRQLPRLDATIHAGEVWLRVERQALVALPGTQGVLFGIRVEVYPLADVIADEQARQGLRRALVSMPEAMAAYKGLATARAPLVGFLG